ncbi:MAG: cell wall hydrolase [Ectothiorhodospiraceae bacterium]|nr:cell wall hydrolase [Ectothiorhodospiraceae bacterium]
MCQSLFQQLLSGGILHIRKLAQLIVLLGVSTTPSLASDAKQMRCLALNIYFEARGETTEGQLAVAMVTVNRVKSRHYPNTVCGVVWQKRQFSWTHDGRSDRPRDIRAWKLAQKISRFAYQKYGNFSERTRNALDLTKGALHYYAPELALPYWAKVHSVTREIGRHIFLTGRS